MALFARVLALLALAVAAIPLGVWLGEIRALSPATPTPKVEATGYATVDGGRTWAEVFGDAVAAAAPSPTPSGPLPAALGAVPEAGAVVFTDGRFPLESVFAWWRYTGATGALERIAEPTDPAKARAPAEARCAALSPDGRRFAYVGADHKVRLLEADGTTRALVPELDVAMLRWSPTGRALAVGRLPLPGTTRPLPGASLGPHMFLPNELWLVDPASGARRLLYEEPNPHTPQYYPKVPLRITTWSPDDRYLGVAPGAGMSASLEADGLHLLLIDTRSGARIPLGPMLGGGARAVWTAPDELLFVAGGGRESWTDKTVRTWSAHAGTRDLSRPGTVGLAPAYDRASGRIYFVEGVAGQYTPAEFFPGKGVGQRHLLLHDEKGLRELPRSPEYAEDGVKVSADGSRLLVLRRRFVPWAEDRSTEGVLELWLFSADGTAGKPLVRLAAGGFGYYGSYGAFQSLDWRP